MRPATAASNPLARLALEAPPMLSILLSIGGRLAGTALAAYIASDQSYDPTQVFVTGVAAFALLTLVPAPRGARVALSALASGVLFLGGALLVNQAAGVAMLIAGAAAVLGVLMSSRRAGGELTPPLGGFFAGFGLTALWVIAIIFTVEG